MPDTAIALASASFYKDDKLSFIRFLVDNRFCRSFISPASYPHGILGIKEMKLILEVRRL